MQRLRSSDSRRRGQRYRGLWRGELGVRGQDEDLPEVERGFGRGAGLVQEGEGRARRRLVVLAEGLSTATIPTGGWPARRAVEPIALAGWPHPVRFAALS